MPHGTYPDGDVCAIGDQISSTGEGRHLTLFADNLTHSDALSYVTKGYPVIFGDAIGISFDTQLAGENLLTAFDTEGIWCVDVLANNDAGGSAVIPGDKLYINTTTLLVSKINDVATQIPFGYAVGNVASGDTDRIAVKLHWDPTMDSALVMYKTVTSGAYNYGKHWVGRLEAGQSTGVAGYFAAEIDGEQDGGIYGFGAWIEPQASFVADGSLLACHDVGIWCANGAGQDMSLARIVGSQMCLDIGENPASIHWFRVNSSAQTGDITAIIAAANPGSVGYIADVVDNAGANKLGNVPLFDIVGVGIGYVEVFSA